MNWDDDFMCLTSSHFSEMRLLIEGAIHIFEEDAGPLFRLARDAEQHEAMSAMNDIGTALYELRQHVKQLQEAHRKEAQRQRGPQIPDNNNEK